MMSIQIIRAGVEQVSLAARLFDSYRQFYGQKPDLPGATAFLTERLSRGESVLFVAQDGEEPLGFVQLYPSFSSVRMRPIWVLNDLFVAESARRRGVARLLMDAALALARSTGAARLVLATAKDNGAARSLYLSLGYRVDEAFDHLELTLD
jgi:ribosomal protein S18 acetylase RimI-like enzyme